VKAEAWELLLLHCFSDGRIVNAPSPEKLSLMLRAFLIRLAALDGQLLDSPGTSLLHCPSDSR
jgi:hypothetical protein